MIVVVDYDLGNPGSVANMFKRQGISVTVSRDAQVVAEATRLVLGGVGAFDHGIRNIEKLGLRGVLERKVLEEKVPIIGFCLGMQLMTEGSEEGSSAGLGWLDARTVHLRTFYEDDAAGLRFPHIGWNFVYRAKTHEVLDGIPEPMRFYFVHTYKVVCRNIGDVLIRSSYSGIPFTAGVVRGNVCGVQFHPEKSHKYGMQLLTNFAAWVPSQAS
jgi:glutamine amidotransferase